MREKRQLLWWVEDHEEEGVSLLACIVIHLEGLDQLGVLLNLKVFVLSLLARVGLFRYSRVTSYINLKLEF